MIKLRDRAISEKITQLSYMNKEAQESGNLSDKIDLQQLMAQYTHMKNRLDDVRRKLIEYRRK